MQCTRIQMPYAQFEHAAFPAATTVATAVAADTDFTFAVRLLSPLKMYTHTHNRRIKEEEGSIFDDYALLILH